MSALLSRISAFYLGAVGAALLFAPELLLAQWAPGVTADAEWIAQLLAAAWLGVAITNWNGRANVMGGIYGRPQVNLNLFVYVVGSLSLLRANAPSVVLWTLTIPMALLGVAYAAFFLFGPFDRSTGRD